MMRFARHSTPHACNRDMATQYVSSHVHLRHVTVATVPGAHRGATSVAKGM